MEYAPESTKPHAVCVPFPAQGHINPMLKLAILLHHKGFHITFVNTEYNHNRLLKSQGSSAFNSYPGFQFDTIPDGLPPPDDSNATQDIPSLCISTKQNCLAPFLCLLEKLNASPDIPQVSCIVSDAIMTFAVKAGNEIGIPVACFRTTNASSFLCNKHLPLLIEKGLLPLKDANCLANGYLETVVDCIPALKNIRLKEFPTFVRTTDINNPMLTFIIGETEVASKASALIFNTFDSLESDALLALSRLCPPVFSIGPVHHFTSQIPDTSLKFISSSLWKDEPECRNWLDSKGPNSVIYMNFGSITVLTPEQLLEFAWGLANSKKDFLWIIRSNSVVGDNATKLLPPDFLEETRERGLILSWCPQENVLRHRSVGGFLTHCGWNSVIESLACGVPMICWPFFADQFINCWLVTQRGVGLEMDKTVKRCEVEKLVTELVEGDKGRKMKKKAEEWKYKAEEAIGTGGSSYMNLDKLVDVLSKPGPS